jgi:hypothetical protein
MVVLGTTIHEFACHRSALFRKLVDGRTKSDHDEMRELAVDELRRPHLAHVAHDLVVDEAGLLGHFLGCAHDAG